MFLFLIGLSQAGDLRLGENIVTGALGLRSGKLLPASKIGVIENAKQVACASIHSLLATDSKVYSTGLDLNDCLGRTGMGPYFLPVSLEVEQVRQVACGHSHSIALSECGKMCVWGSNTFGKLVAR